MTLAQVAPLFIAPALAAAGAAAVAIPIAIHLLSRFRRKRQPWGAMRFIREAYSRHRRRLRMEQWLLLALRCLIVVVLGLALAGPMLSGCSRQLQAMGLMAGEGRTVHVVIDDALSTQAIQADGSRTFEALKATAEAVVGSVGPRDQVHVWTTSQGKAGGTPSAADAQPGASEGGGADRPAKRIEALEPSYAGYSMGDALERVAGAMQGGSEAAAAAEPIVVLISGWSGSSVDEHRPPPALAGARLVVSPPMAGAVNVQVESVSPRRRRIVADLDGGATISIEARIRRFGGGESAEAGLLRLELLDRQGRSLASSQRSIRFPAGQAAVTVNEALRLSSQRLPRSGGAQRLVIRASLEPADAAMDALAADNERFATVEVRPTLGVMVVEPAPGGVVDDLMDPISARFAPRRWLELALAPAGGADAGPIETAAISPADLAGRDPEALRDADVVMAPRPDELSQAAWSNLAGFVDAGGLVWLWTPPGAASAMWTHSLRSVLGVQWQVAIEPTDMGGPDRGVGLALEGPPAALSMLASDWEALLRPVRVYRWLPLWTPRDDAWLALDLGGGEASPVGEGADAAAATGDGGGGGASTAALLAFHERGRGGVVMLASALDMSWTNLPAKPLFVPLLHESLRAVVGRAPSPAMTVDQFAVSDDGTWARLNLSETSGPGEADPATAPPRPGVYVDSAGAAALPVNVDADAGDTLAMDGSALAAWLDGLGAWSFLDPADPAGSLLRPGDAAASLGWPLLWILLALVLLETVLARTFSHGGVETRRGLAATVVQRLRRLHLGRDDQRRAA